MIIRFVKILKSPNGEDLCNLFNKNVFIKYYKYILHFWKKDFLPSIYIKTYRHKILFMVLCL